MPFSMSIDAYYHAASHVLPLCSCLVNSRAILVDTKTDSIFFYFLSIQVRQALVK